ncbi:hypothetical protein KCU95_g10315, partial [Aureobasidium melanogenum]
MAEVFGAVASGIGIAGVAAQAIDGIRKLQAFCNDIRDAPEDIKYLTTELEILLGTIASIEAQIQRNSTMCQNMDPTPALRFVDQSVRSLNAVIEKLNGEINQKRTLGSMKMAWKKKVLESHLIKIERSKTSLGLAVSAYSTELYLQTATRTDTKIDQLSMDVTTLAISSQTQLVSKSGPQTKMTQKNGSSQQLRVYNDDNGESIRKKSRSPKVASVLSFSLILPSWLMQHSLKITLGRAAQSWTLSLRPYRTIAWNADIWQAIEDGDFDKMRNLIESGQATVFDRRNDGYTLLHALGGFATSLGPETFSCMARYLIDRGADINEPMNRGSPSVEKELRRRFPLDTLNFPAITMAARLREIRTFEWSFPPERAANYLGIESFEVAYSMSSDDTKRDLFRIALNKWGLTSGEGDAAREEWQDTVQGLFALGARFELLGIGEEKEKRVGGLEEGIEEDEAVVEVIRQFVAQYFWSKVAFHFPSIQYDIRDLVDGFEYFISRSECLDMRLGPSSSCRRFELCLDEEFMLSTGRFIKESYWWEPLELSLYYDDNLSIWVMWDSTYEAYCGEFWDLMDSPERTMPGTWIE